MTTRWRRILIAISLACGVIVVLLAGARAAAPGWIRGAIERIAGNALGRELRIAGDFDLSVSLTPSITASDVTLANAPWGSQPSMARVGRIRVAVDLASLWSGPARVRDLALDDVRVLLEADGEGQRNWAFATKPSGRPPTTELPFVVERASLRGFELTYRPGRDARPVILTIEELDADLDSATRMIDVQGRGHLNESPWDIAGQLGTLDRLFAGRDVDQALSGHIGRASLTLSGRIRDPMTLEGPNVEISVDGPEVVEALAVGGLRSPLTGPFRLHGRLEPNDEGIAFDVSGAVGGVTATARGTVSALLDPVRIDATVDAHGPHASEVGSWTGVVGLPPAPFDLAGRIRRAGSQLSVEDVTLHAGGTSLTVAGQVGALPRCVGTDLQVTAKGKDLSELSALTRLKLPEVAFEVEGRFLRRADGLAIEDATVAVQGALIHASGTIGEPPRLDNLDLTADGAGPDASFLSGVARIDLKTEPFEIRGRVARNGKALDLDDVAGHLGDDTFAVTGRLVPVRGLVGSDARVRVTGRNLEDAASPTGLRGLPAERFDAVGHVRVATDHYEFDDVDASVGGLTIRLDGIVGSPTPLNGTSLLCRARGASLSDLAAWGIPAKLPPDPFAASGQLRIDGGVYRVDDVSADVGADRLAVDGTLGALPDVAAMDLGVTASGPDLSGLARFVVAAGADPPSRIPVAPFTVTGRVRRTSSGVELGGVKAGVGNAKLDAEGLLSFEDRWLGTDVTLEIDAPDTVMLSEVVGTDFPEETLRARGRIRSTPEGLRFDGAEVSLGASFAQLTGIVGVPPHFAGTDIDFSVEGSNLAVALLPWTGTASIPVDSFALSAHLAGSLEHFAGDRLNARLGDSDLTGHLSTRLAGRPFVDAELHSQRFDAPRLIAGFTREPEIDAATEAPAKKTRRKGDRLIPDWPLDLDALGTFDARFRLAADEVPFPGVPTRDVVIAGDLTDGVLTIDDTEGTGANGGRLRSSASIRPEGDGYRLHVEGSLENGRLDVSKTDESAASAPSLEISYEMDGAGRSLHEIAASGNGQALVVLGPGRIPNAVLGGGSSATIASLMDALNPFRKSSPYTTLECGVAAAALEGGMMAVQPIAVRGDKLTVLGKGKIDFGTEAIDLSWTIKPRRNVGLSPGSIANPYIRLGGTLASPRLDVKPLEAVASTGAAVATAGLTILLRGIYNRITAEKKVCVQALAKVRKQRDEFEARKSAASSE